MTLDAGFRRGLHRVAGGFTLTTRFASVIVSWRPAPAEWRLLREPDVNGYRGIRLGRLLLQVSTGRRPLARDIPPADRTPRNAPTE